MQARFIINSLFALTSLGLLAGSNASAAKVEGNGSISGGGSLFTEYADPHYLLFGNTVQLGPNQVGPGGHETMSYTGEAQFGRLGATAFVGGTHVNTPDLSASSDVNVSFQDKISVQSLNLLAPAYLRLDVDVHGIMNRGDQTFGNSTNAYFGVTQFSNNMSQYENLALLQFSWFGGTFLIENTKGDLSQSNGFVADPGHEPEFHQILQPGGGFGFGAKGHIDVPLSTTRFGQSFILDFAMKAFAGTSTDNTFADTNFGNTALIGNARIVDQNGNVLAGPSFISESGYDYITPPNAIPEPGTAALLLFIPALCRLATRRRAAKI